MGSALELMRVRDYVNNSNSELCDFLVGVPICASLIEGEGLGVRNLAVLCNVRRGSNTCTGPSWRKMIVRSEFLTTSWDRYSGDYWRDLTREIANHEERDLRSDRDGVLSTPLGNSFEGMVTKTPLRPVSKYTPLDGVIYRWGSRLSNLVLQTQKSVELTLSDHSGQLRWKSYVGLRSVKV